MSLAVTLTPIGGDPVDVTEYLSGGTFRLGRSLGGDGANCSFGVVNYPGPVTMGSVVATWGADRIYQGQVLRRKRRASSDVTWIDPECVDAVIRMQRRLVARTYQGVRADAILLDLLSRYMPEVTPEIAPIGAELDITFNYVTLYEAITRVTEAVGAYWYLTPDDHLRAFVGYYDPPGAIPEYNPNNILADSFEDELATSEFANRVWVLGSKQASIGFKNQVFSGSSNVYQLGYEPNYTEIRINGGPLRKVHLKENAQAGTEFVVDKKRKLVEPLIALAASDSVEIRYRPTIEVVDYFEDVGSVQTYGLYEMAIKDRTITDKTAARQRGRTALRRSSMQRPTFRWQTDQLWHVYPGQRCALVYPQWSINQVCRITDVDAQFQWLGHRWNVVASITAEAM